jgi:hypothetical protein
MFTESLVNAKKGLNFAEELLLVKGLLKESLLLTNHVLFHHQNLGVKNYFHLGEI